MRKKLKKWGNNLVAVFTKEDEEVYGLVVGDVIDFEEPLKHKVIEKEDK